MNDKTSQGAGAAPAIKPTTPVSLSKLLEQAPNTEDLRKKQNAHRVLVITSVARIDDDLLRLLRRSLAPSVYDRDELLEEGGVIGTLVLRAKLCVRMKLISYELYKLIKDLADLRNSCAHTPNDDFNVFNEQSTKDKIDNYWNRLNSKLFDRKISETEERFKLICNYLHTYFYIITQDVKGGSSLDSETVFFVK